MLSRCGCQSLLLLLISIAMPFTEKAMRLCEELSKEEKYSSALNSKHAGQPVRKAPQ